MKAGFTLIELIASLALTGMLMSLLFSSFFLTNRSISIAEPLIEADVRCALIHNQLVKELEGVFIPVQAELKKTGSSVVASSLEKNQPKPLDKIFYSTNKNNRLEILSFITNNPLKIYYDEKSGTPKPAVVRVVYRLIETKDKNYTLLRQESSTLEFEAFEVKASKPIRSYEVANNIKNITMEYAFGKKSDAKKESIDQTASGGGEIVRTSEWHFDEWRKKDPKTSMPRVPQFVTMKMVLWDAQLVHENIFDIMIEIPTFSFLTEQRSTSTQSSEATPTVAPVVAATTPSAPTPVAPLPDSVAATLKEIGKQTVKPQVE